MRVIIAAAHPGPHWTGDLPRHLVPVGGGPLLARTIRQARTLTDDVHVTVPDDDRYTAAVQDARAHVRADPGFSEYHGTRDLWSTSGRTVLLLGDVYFTNRAMRIIGSYEPRQYRAFGRKGRSKVTGCRWGELFAVSWWPQHHDMLDAHLAEVVRLRESGQCTRPPGWVLLRLMQGTPPGRHQVDRRWFTAIDDATDDLDEPADVDRHPATRATT